MTLLAPGSALPPPAPARGVRREAAATLRLAAPLIGGNLAGMGLSFIDTVMAGNLDARSLAAVAVGASTWSAINLFLIGVLLAIPPHVAQLEGEATAASRAAVAPFARQAFWVGQGLAVVAILALANVRPLLELLDVQPEIVPLSVGYLHALAWGVPAWCVYLTLRFLSEGLGATRPTLYFALLGLPVNVVANRALMYGELGLPALGAVGCGWATALVWWAECLGIVVYVGLNRRYRDLELFGRLDRPRWRPIAEILGVGLPIGVSIFVEGSLFAAVALVIGSLGTEVVAGHQVALNFAAITFMVPLGLAMAVTVRVGNAAGRRDPAGVRFAALVGVGMGMLWQVAGAAVMLAFPRQVAAIYTDDPRVIAVAVELLFLAAVFQLSDGLQVGSAGALRGIKDTRVPMAITVVAYWLVGLPCGYWLAFGRRMGAAGMWIGLIAGLTLAAVLLVLRFVRVTRPAAAAPGR
jgi:MATE family multidrug resistance protein